MFSVIENACAHCTLPVLPSCPGHALDVTSLPTFTFKKEGDRATGIQTESIKYNNGRIIIVAIPNRKRAEGWGWGDGGGGGKGAVIIETDVLCSVGHDGFSVSTQQTAAVWTTSLRLLFLSPLPASIPQPFLCVHGFHFMVLSRLDSTSGNSIYIFFTRGRGRSAIGHHKNLLIPTF